MQGDVDAALRSAAHTLARTYTVAYIAHVPLEPRAAVAEWTTDARGEKLTVWTGTQRPFGVKEELMRAFDLADDRVRVIMPDTGSGLRRQAHRRMRRRSRPPGPRRAANRSSSSGRARRNSAGPTSARPA